MIDKWYKLLEQHFKLLKKVKPKIHLIYKIYALKINKITKKWCMKKRMKNRSLSFQFSVVWNGLCTRKALPDTSQKIMFFLLKSGLCFIDNSITDDYVKCYFIKCS